MPFNQFQNIANPALKIAQSVQKVAQTVNFLTNVAARGISAGASAATNVAEKVVSDYKSLSSQSEIAANRGVLTFKQEGYGSNITKDTENPTLKEPGFEILTYPPDLGNKKFYMRMDFKKYKRPSPELQGEISTLHSICLPLPTQLEDSYKIDYDPYDGGIAAIVLNQAAPGQNISPAAPIKFISDRVSPMLGGEGGNIVNIASQNLAAALNPNKSVLFKSPDFKRYSFSWVFAPNNPKESQIIRKLIRKIKGSSLPTYAKTNILGSVAKDYNIFNYPDMVKVYLYPWASRDALKSQGFQGVPEMFQTKHCVIDSININYSPENNISFFADGANSPTFIALTINLLEIELFTGGDFGREGSVVDVTKILGEDVNKQLLAVFGANANTEIPLEPLPTPTS